MTIAEAIRAARNEDEVYALLNIYLDAVELPEEAAEIKLRPIESSGSVYRHTQLLFVALGWVSRRLDDRARIAIKEALNVFTAASNRLRLLAERNLNRVTTREARNAREELDRGCTHHRPHASPGAMLF